MSSSLWLLCSIALLSINLVWNLCMICNSSLIWSEYVPWPVNEQDWNVPKDSGRSPLPSHLSVGLSSCQHSFSPVLHFLFSYSFLLLLSARFVVRLSLKSVTASISMVGCVSALIHHLNQMDRCHLLLKVGLHTQMEYKYSIEQSNKEDKRHERHVLSLGHLEIKILEIERNSF